MATNTPVAELDFIKLKQELIDFIKSNPTFTDYNFEGSALNTLMDILAYNTHYNAFYANMLHNESFLDTAQKRTSVVSKAKQYGYVPRSVLSSTAIVDIEILSDSFQLDSAVLKRGTIAQSKNEFGSFNFVVEKDVSLSKETDGSFFRNVVLKEGIITSNTYTVDSNTNPNGFYTIPNANVDMSTLRVFVRGSDGTLDVQEFHLENDFDNIDSDSNVYFIQESFEGLYQIYFGDGIFGKSLEDGNIIDIFYVLANKEIANGCRSFFFEELIPDSQNLVTTLQESSGGKEKESLTELKDSIKKSFASQNRAVTTNDYVSIVKRVIPFATNVSVWGGEDSLPPQYGKVFVSIQTNNNSLLSDVTKKDIIIPEIKKYNVLTVIPEIVDPKFTFVRFDVDIKFNKNKTNSTIGAITLSTTEQIDNYFATNTSTFNKDLIKSQLVKNLLQLDEGIVGVSINTTNNFRISPTLGVKQSHFVVESNFVEKGSVNSSFFKMFINDSEKIVRIIDDPSRSFIKADINRKNREFGILKIVDENDISILDIGTVLYKSDTVASSGIFEFETTLSNYIQQSNVYMYYKCETEDIFSSRNQILLRDTSQANSIINVLNGVNITITNYEK